MIDLTEIFNSISGEVSPWRQGCLTTFVRLYGCNLNCSYCDTPQGIQERHKISEDEFISAINSFYSNTGKICLTGGEPMIQKDVVKLVTDNFPNVWIETNGTFDMSDFIGDCGIVTDIKLDLNIDKPDMWFYLLRPTDFIKFVIYDLDSYREATRIQRNLQMGGCDAAFAYSPCSDKINPKVLFDKLLTEKLPNTIMNIQIHKLLGFK